MTTNLSSITSHIEVSYVLSHVTVSEDLDPCLFIHQSESLQSSQISPFSSFSPSDSPPPTHSSHSQHVFQLRHLASSSTGPSAREPAPWRSQVGSRHLLRSFRPLLRHHQLSYAPYPHQSTGQPSQPTNDPSLFTLLSARTSLPVTSDI